MDSQTALATVSTCKGLILKSLEIGSRLVESRERIDEGVGNGSLD